MSNPFPQVEGWIFCFFSDSHRRAANWNLARRAGGQVVRQICVVVLSLTRSASFYGTTNWNLAASPN